MFPEAGFRVLRFFRRVPIFSVEACNWFFSFEGTGGRGYWATPSYLCPLSQVHPRPQNSKPYPLISPCSRCFLWLIIVPMDERDFFEEKESKKPHTLTCPHCRQAGEYELAWLVRTKKKQLSGRADERDRAKFAKAQSYMVRRDDMVMCKNIRCRKRFEVAGVQSVAFLN